jgi:hypothetical protein
MKLIILCLYSANKPSLISESVTEIWNNSQPCKGINLTTWHTQARRAPRVATIHDVTKKPGRVLPRPSAVLHAYASADIPWVAEHYPIIHPWSEVRYRPTPRRTKLLSLRIPWLVCVITFKCLFIRTQPTRASSDTGGGYHLEPPNIKSDHSPSFPCSILHSS